MRPSMSREGTPTKLPKTGIDQAFLAKHIQFSRKQKEIELIADTSSTLKSLVEDYKLRDNMKTNHAKMVPRNVYDCFESQSPFYEKDTYIDNKQAIIVQPPAGHPNYLQPSVSKKGQETQPMNRFFTKLNPYYKAKDSTDETLVFESRFESGNLRRALQVDKYEYDLILKTDYKTNNFTQWYFFKVSNTKKFRQY